MECTLAPETSINFGHQAFLEANCSHYIVIVIAILTL